MTTTADDYAGPFDPAWSLERLSRRALARLARENMLLSMIHNQSFIPHLAIAGGREATIEIAEAEWMGASPIYTERNRRNLGWAGDGVPEIFKAFQFDIGVPHHFLDFRFEVTDRHLGSFWLAYCGAYQHVRLASGDDEGAIFDMCHHMEDRTFDASLGATNPAARVHAVHRPPTPAEGSDGAHCRWEVRIGPEGEPPYEHPMLQIMRGTKAARFEFVLGDSLEDGGVENYAGPFDPQFRLEDLSHALLVRQVKEFALDVHLLMRSGYTWLDEEKGPELLDDLAVQDRAAMMPMAVRRLRDALRIDGDGIEAIAKLLQVHPLLPRDYVGYGVSVDDDRSGRLWVTECDGFDDEGAGRSPLSWLREPDSPTFDSLVRTVNPHGVVEPIDPTSVTEADAVAAWRFHIDPEATAPALPWTTDLIGLNGMATFDLSERPVPVRLSPRSHR
jgi:hypothetical protein